MDNIELFPGALQSMMRREPRSISGAVLVMRSRVVVAKVVMYGWRGYRGRRGWVVTSRQRHHADVTASIASARRGVCRHSRCCLARSVPNVTCTWSLLLGQGPSLSSIKHIDYLTLSIPMNHIWVTGFSVNVPRHSHVSDRLLLFGTPSLIYAASLLLIDSSKIMLAPVDCCVLPLVPEVVV